ncbi:MAG: hypothetical protein COV36_02210 [Alphaproteobacteria bacterium CG11_big_fil_rev_8_21_14_0_20_44_7]|nr:MAG: hypothetical protein COV36_02210 [Alphaproteobacteria bacterium CG11_big_fil_rev_8_21_14_0_20_44_7]
MLKKNKPKQKLRIFQGVVPQNNQARFLSEAFNELGYKSDYYTVKDSKFKFDSGKRIFLEGDTTSLPAANFMAEIAPKYDVFHFHARSLLHFKPGHAEKFNFGFPYAMDLLFLRLLGKKIYVHFRGSEIRLEHILRENNPYQWLDEPGKNYLQIPDEKKILWRDFLYEICDGTFATDAEVMESSPQSKIVERVIKPKEYPHIGLGDMEKPLIVHAPTSRNLKGTEHIIKALEKLTDNGYKFDFKLVQNLPHEKAKELYASADIILDQIRVGWYGITALEAMAMGKIAVCYVKEEYDPKHKIPLVSANLDNIYDNVKHILDNKDYYRKIAAKGRKFVEENHAPQIIAKQLIKEYEKPQKTAIDITKIAAFMDYTNKKSVEDALAYQKLISSKNNTAYKQPSQSTGRRIKKLFRDPYRFCVDSKYASVRKMAKVFK